MISIPSFAPSASKPHDKDAKREQNPHYTRYNGLHFRFDTQQVEGALLDLCRPCEQSQLGSAALDDVACKRGEIGEQCAEAVNRLSIVRALFAGLALGRWRGLCLGYRRRAGSFGGGPVVIVKQDGRQCLAHMPFEMIGEHAQEHVGAHARAGPVVDRTNFEVYGLDAAKGPFDTGQALVGAHRSGGIDSFGWHTGTQHVEAIERPLFGDRCVISLEGQRVVGDGKVEVLGNLSAADDLANGKTDLVSPAQGLALALDALLNLLQVLLGGIEQLIPLAPALLGESMVLTDDEALARKVRALDLGEIARVEKRQLQGAAFSGELLDCRSSQRGNPVDPGRLEIAFNTGLSDHPAIADHHHTLEPEALLELHNLIADG